MITLRLKLMESSFLLEKKKKRNTKQNFRDIGLFIFQ